MPDTPFKAMGREKETPRVNVHYEVYEREEYGVPCEACGERLIPGDWPFCAGRPSDHWR